MKQLKKAGRFLCSMKFAIILLVVIVLVCTVGSVVPQGKDASWYTANYSRQAAGAVMLFGLDDVFHSWWFIVLIVNCLFYDLIKNADEELTQTWLGLGLTAIDIILIVLMFRGI